MKIITITFTVFLTFNDDQKLNKKVLDKFKEIKISKYLSLFFIFLYKY